MKNLIDSIFEKNFSDAEAELKEGLASLVEKKLWEKKKMLMADDDKKKNKTVLVTTKGDPKAKKGGGVKRIPASEYDQKVHNLAVEAVVHSDGLVHLNTGENILPSVYRQRRWLAESNEWSDWLADTYHDLKDHKDKNVRHHVRMAMAQHKKGNTEDAHEHMKAAQRAAHKLQNEAMSSADINTILKSPAPIKGQVDGQTNKPVGSIASPKTTPTASPATSSSSTTSSPEAVSKFQSMMQNRPKETSPPSKGTPTIIDKNKPSSPLGPSKGTPTIIDKSKSFDPKMHIKPLEEDCGLDPEKEAKIHAAMEKARLLIEPKLDTTAPGVDRTKLTIPKGIRRGDRLSAPDLGPKEDEWMHGKKLEEGVARDIIKGLKLKGQIKKYKKSEDKKSLQRANELENLKNTKQFKHDAPNLYKYGYKLGSSTQVKFDPSRYKQIKNWASKKDD